MTAPLRTVYVERIPATDPRLGRHINHDSRSRGYAFAAPRRALTDVHHQSWIDILDQGNLGSCTGNAGIGCLGRGRFWPTVNGPTRPGWFTLDEAGAVDLYSAASRLDPFAGEWPPVDSGSDGLSIGKALKAAGMISGYEWTFSLDAALQALMDRPVITGINWYDAMFNPDPEGLVHPAGGIAGGHEIVADEYLAGRGWVGLSNSWGAGWGKRGRFYLQAEDWGRLLAEAGDVTVFVPRSAPPPTPPPDPDAEFAAVLHGWLGRRPWCYRPVQRAARAWLAAKGL